MAGRTATTTTEHSERPEVQISAEQKALFRRAAALQGRTLTEFVVSSAQKVAVRTIKESRTIALNADESRVFAEALLNPREPTDQLRAAARRHNVIVGR